MALWTADPRSAEAEVIKYGTPIWEDLFLVRMRMRDTVSTADLERFGLPTAYNAALDKEMHNSLSTIMITADDIVEHHRRGAQVIFVNNADADRLYHMLNDYLGAWNRMLQAQINIGGAPIDDLVFLDSMCEKLFQQARQFHGPSTRHPFLLLEGMFKGRGAMISRREMMTLKDEPNTKVSVNGEPEEPEKHQSFAQAFGQTFFKSSVNKEPAGEKPSGSTRWK